MKLTADKRAAMPQRQFAGGGPKGKKGFPLNDAVHARLAISGATRSYNAGNISKSKEEAIKAEARHKLGASMKDGYSAPKPPRAPRPSESLNARGHFENHGKGEVSHSTFHALDHGSQHDHMKGRDGGADGLADEI